MVSTLDCVAICRIERAMKRVKSDKIVMLILCFYNY